MSPSTLQELGFAARKLLACCCSCICLDDAPFPVSCRSSDIWRTLAPPLLSSCLFSSTCSSRNPLRKPRTLFCIPHFEHLAPLLERFCDVAPCHHVKKFVPHAPFLRRPARAEVCFSLPTNTLHFSSSSVCLDGPIPGFTEARTACLVISLHLTCSLCNFQLQTLGFLVLVLVSLNMLQFVLRR